jgi:hypothetical protein
LVAFPDERVEVAERKNFYPEMRKNLKNVEGVRSKREWFGASSGGKRENVDRRKGCKQREPEMATVPTKAFNLTL